MMSERSQELDALYETAPVGLCALDRELRFLRINRRMAAISGRPAAEHIGRTLREMLPDLASALEDLCKRTLESGRAVVDRTLRAPGDPAGECIRKISCSPLFSGTESAIGVSLVVRDFDERGHSEEKYRRLVETANDAIFIADADGVIVDANRRVEELLDQPIERIIGMHQTQPHPEEEGERYAKIFQRHLRTGPASGDHR